MEQVVELKEISEGVALIKMQDKVSKNTFSPKLMSGLIDAFKSIRNQNQYKAVILTGYDTYFASGGTQEQLLTLSDGKAKFTESDLYSLALNCPIPVISAMQGHGIGGGFAMGLFADVVILSRESFYTTNFMKYGFTPGMGATFILPQKLGISLASEMLLSAKTYRGTELQGRGIPFPVVPRNKVLDDALEMAKTLAEKPREVLIALKDHLVEPQRKKLPEIIEKEIIMHDKTFGQPGVKERILTLFGK